MGCNYYARINCCEKCSKPDKTLHIGKSSYGWTFSFQALRYWDAPDEKPIDSEQRWREVLSSASIRIFNEYDKECDKNEFWKMVDEKRDSKNNQTLYCQEHYPHEVSKDNFLDAKGNSFSWSDFS